MCAPIQHIVNLRTQSSTCQHSIPSAPPHQHKCHEHTNTVINTSTSHRHRHQHSHQHIHTSTYTSINTSRQPSTHEHSHPTHQHINSLLTHQHKHQHINTSSAHFSLPPSPRFCCTDQPFLDKPKLLMLFLTHHLSDNQHNVNTSTLCHSRVRWWWTYLR
jgi:hypothetical protein